MNDNECKIVEVSFTKEEALAFIQGNNERNPSEALVKGAMKEKRFNWCAFFFGFIYCIYRKCYMAALAFIGIDMIAIIPNYILNGNTIGIVWFTTNLIVSILYGFLFYPFYRNTIINEKSKYVNLCLEHRLKEFRKRGGTSPKALFITIFLLFALTIFAFLLLIVEAQM